LGKYKETAKEIYIIGVEFEPEKRNIVRFEWERVRQVILILDEKFTFQ